MSPEAQRMAIAEACGWFWLRDGFGSWWFHPPDDAVKFKPEWVVENNAPTDQDRERGSVVGSGRRDELLPDYVADLNAMHEAEKVLTNEQRRYYASLLVETHPLKYSPVGDGVSDAWMKLFLIASMTAAQRAEALLRTIGKWDDSK